MMVGRGPKRKGTRYYGPYSHAWAIRETVDLLLRVFPMRSCRPGVFKNHKQLGPALPAGLHREVLGAVRRPDQRRGAPGDRRRLLLLRRRPGRADDQAAGAGDAGGQRRAGVRAGRPAAGRHRSPAAGHGAERGGPARRHRRRCDRSGRGPAGGGRPDLPRPRRPGPRPARLGGRPVRRLRQRRADRAVPAPAVRRDRSHHHRPRRDPPRDPGSGAALLARVADPDAERTARVTCRHPSAAARRQAGADGDRRPQRQRDSGQAQDHPGG